MVGNTKPGTKAALTVYRRGSTKELAVTIGEIEAEKTARKTTEKSSPPRSSTVAQAMGLTVSDLTDAQKKELKLKGGVKVDAAADSAARAGIREGDIIVAIGNVEVGTLKEFESAVAKLDRTKPIPVLLRRGELASYLLIRPSR